MNNTRRHTWSTYTLDRLPTRTREKLIEGRYVNFDMLPDDPDSPEWTNIRNTCCLEYHEFITIINVKFAGRIYWDGKEL